MSSKNHTSLKTKPSLKPYSQLVLERFSNSFDCLTAHQMGTILTPGNGKSLEQHNSDHPFFCPPTENDYQYLRRAGVCA